MGLKRGPRNGAAMKVLHLLAALSLATAVLAAGCAAGNDDADESRAGGNGSTQVETDIVVKGNGTNETNGSVPPANGTPSG